ncbi:jg6064, partial [Pararge aegeria aegeria]
MYINNPSISYVKANWDDMQRELLCCGFYGQYFMVLENLPISCCSIPVGARSPFECTTRNSYYERCDEKLSWMMDDNAYNIGVTGAVLTCVQ